ncbi:MAG: 16S rRNA (cytidine(1402)-2'-O)-methyltransferase [Candidatus Eisenbacteria bacterium]
MATPIGNLADMTHRAVETLGEVDAIASEDTRRTRKLLSHYGIRTPLVSYHEHNEERAARAVVDRLLDGQSIALVTDAGTPLVSDPGYRLVELAVREGVPVVSVPGPSAVVAALSVAGLPPMPFHFEGFLPRKSAARRTKLGGLCDLRGTLVFYVSPHRVGPVLVDMLEVLGDRRAVLARELTKIHEELLRGTLSELSDEAAGRSLKGEMVVLVEGRRS